MAELVKGNIAKLNSENYQVWKFKMELLLIKEDLWSQVNTTMPTEEIEARNWKIKDDKARATIGLLVEDSQLVHIRKANNAKDVWDSLKNYHEKSTLTSKIYLLRQICNLKLQETGNLEEHIITMQDLVDKLTAIGEEIKDHLFVAMLLSSLPASYNTLITALESRSEDELTLNMVKGKLIDEYRRRKGVPHTSEACTALKVSQKGTEKTCYFCHKAGHFKHDCIKYKKWKANKEKSNKVNKVEEQENFVCFSTHQTSNVKNAWYLDSGATSHMTNNKTFFEEFRQIKLPNVILANGKGSNVEGIGTGKLRCLDGNSATTIILKDVLFVPDLTENLISVKKLTEKGFTVQFKDQKGNIMKNDTVVMTANLSDNMYALNIKQQALTVKKENHTSNCQHIWHRRFGHRNFEDIKLIQEKGLVLGMKIQDCGIRETCECCIKGKLTRSSFPHTTRSRTAAPLDLLHTDLCGPMQTQTPNGNKYFMTIIDDHTRYCEVCFLKDKSEAVQRIKEYVRFVKNKFNKVPKIIRSDNGREYVNKELRSFLAEEGIQSQYTAPYSPEQNGVAERKNRTLMEAARCMLIDAGMKKEYWAEAVNTANYLQNILPTKAVNRTPYELWNQKRANVEHLRVFGCKGYTHVPKEKRRKLEDKAIIHTFVGYSTESKAYRMLDMETNKIIISRDVKFIENDINKETKLNRKERTDIEINLEENAKDDLYHDNSSDSTSTTELEEDSDITVAETVSTSDESFVYPTQGEENSTEVTRKSSRTTRGQLPARYRDEARIVTEITEPLSRTEALEDVDHEKWSKAMDKEIQIMMNNNTWHLCELPEDKKAIGSKWVFKRKGNIENNVKARLVAQGFSQKFGTDYNEVFAPVVRAATLRLLLTIATEEKLQIYHYDAKSAFLNGDLKEIIYMKQPEGYVVKGKENLVCRLNKSIYGLKQSAKLWNEKIHKIITALNFKQSKADQCLYSKKTTHGIQYLIIYVDDILIAGINEQYILETANKLEKEFNLTRLGKLTNYLGIKVEKDDIGIYYINQEGYIQALLKRFGLDNAKGSKFPLDTGYFKINQNETSMKNNEDYRKLVGGLLYVATHTRPDIAASVSILSQKITQPTETDWNEAKRVLRYLKETKNHKLRLGGPEDGLKMYSDADWAQDRSDSKSHSGYVCKYNGSVIDWACRKQTCVAWSSCEAEYIALAEASRELLWIRRLLEDFNKPQVDPIMVYSDNQSAINLVKNAEFKGRTKHIDTKYHFVTDLFKKRVINLDYCPTDNMITDMMTKPLGSIKLKKHREECQLIAPEILSMNNY